MERKEVVYDCSVSVITGAKVYRILQLINVATMESSLCYGNEPIVPVAFSMTLIPMPKKLQEERRKSVKTRQKEGELYEQGQMNNHTVNS